MFKLRPNKKRITKWFERGDTRKLSKALSDRHYTIRILAASALGKLKAKDAKKELTYLLKDKIISVRKAAGNALLRIDPTGKTLEIVRRSLSVSPKCYTYENINFRNKFAERHWSNESHARRDVRQHLRENCFLPIR